MVFLCSCSSSSFMNLLVHALISLPTPSARLVHRLFPCGKIRGGGGGGGGGGARVFWSLKVGLFNQYRTHPLYYCLYGFPLFGYPPSNG